MSEEHTLSIQDKAHIERDIGRSYRWGRVGVESESKYVILYKGT